MCEDSSNFVSTDAWIAAANSAMTSKFDTLGVSSRTLGANSWSHSRTQMSF